MLQLANANWDPINRTSTKCEIAEYSFFLEAGFQITGPIEKNHFPYGCVGIIGISCVLMDAQNSTLLILVIEIFGSALGLFGVIVGTIMSAQATWPSKTAKCSFFIPFLGIQ
ncbi:LOW QUALITY PROTEIN: hypothetical protein RJ641_020075 [Dillenia turbinata]|uniref:V-ATPase proteolipid subunit C-like domain-containing protein n=1 Tax=Dillenia turbinata TaxID=194707 RepID=A0AAN8YZ83_9MAGN